MDAWRGFRPRVGGAIGSPVLRKHKLDVEGIGQPPGLGVPPGLNTPCADLGPLVAARKQECPTGPCEIDTSYSSVCGARDGRP